MREALDVLRQIVKDMLPRQPIFAEVVSYESDTNTITVKPLSDSDNITNVGLNAQGQDDKGFFAVPKVGSDVLIGFVDNVPYLKMYGEVEYVVLKGETFGGVVKIEPLVSMYNTDIAGMKIALSATFASIDSQLVALGQPGGSSGVFNTQWTSVVSGFDKSILENTNVKHG